MQSARACWARSGTHHGRLRGNGGSRPPVAAPGSSCRTEATGAENSAAAVVDAARGVAFIWLLDDGATSDILRLANAASLPDLDAVGGRGTCAPLPMNGLGPPLLDSATPLALPRSSARIEPCTDHRSPLAAAKMLDV